MTNPFEEIAAQLNRMESMLERLCKVQPTPPAPPPAADNNPLTIDQAADFLRLTKGTIYSLVHRKEIPYCKRRKRLYFDQMKLTAWINGGRQQTKDEIREDARNTRITI